MEEAIKKLEALKKEYEQALDMMFESNEYYERYRAKVDAIDEALGLLKG